MINWVKSPEEPSEMGTENRLFGKQLVTLRKCGEVREVGSREDGSI